MEVILLERVEKLGQMGDLVNVKPGYARNFLLPKGKALRATEDNKKRFEAERAKLEADNLARKSDAEKVAAKMEGMSVVLVRAASEMGQLYGSASSRDIAERIREAGVTVDRNQVDLNTAIKTLGLFPVRVVLHPEVSVEVTVNIARSEDEAAEQQRLGRAIISDIAEREREEAAEAAAEAEERLKEMEEEQLADPDAAEAPEGEEGAPVTAKAKKAAAKTAAKGKKKAKAAAKDGGESPDGDDETPAEEEAGAAITTKAKKTKAAASAKSKKKAKTKAKAKAKKAGAKSAGDGEKE